MDLIVQIEDFNINWVGFNNPIPNSIIDGGLFNRLYYSNEFISTNGINLFCTFKDMRVDRYYNKFKIWVDLEKNTKLISKIYEIEKNILTKINIRNKSPSYKLSDHFQSKNIKTNSLILNPDGMCIKISGIWQTKSNYGLTFRFQLANKYRISLDDDLINE